MNLDILAFGAHPDDVELGCSGTILKHNSLGFKTGIIDLTQGELGTRGNAGLRMQEAKKAAEILGVEIRDNLLFADAFFHIDQHHLTEVIKKIRLYRPKIVLCNAITDRHPDHGRSARLISEACFYSGLRKIETNIDGHPQEFWRPNAVYHYVQDRYIKPDIAVDISSFWDKKKEAILAFSSQFYNPDSKEPETPISSKDFLKLVKSRAVDYGRSIGVSYAEGFTVEKYIGVNNLFDLK